MVTYVDGFLIAIPKKNLKAYIALAKIACKIWLDHGAVDYKECVGDDLKVKYGMTFPKLIKQKKDEILIFSFITYKSRKHRDMVNAAVMKDKRMKEACNSKNMPFKMNRMSYGGFKTIVEGTGKSK